MNEKQYYLELLKEKERRIEKQKAISDYSAFSERYIKIVDKNGNQVPFIHNDIQRKINDTVKQLRAEGKPVRIIILKARQEGVSTNEQGRMLWNTVTKPNRTGLIVAHEQPATAKIFEKARYMYNNLPDDVKPLTRASNARELIFDVPTGYKGPENGLNSKISIQVAGDVGIGRGDTLYYVHLSEFAYWPSPEGKEPKKQLAGILQAVPKTPETEVVIESTANGFNDFKELWDDAVAGKSEWTPLFFPWWAYKDYQMSCADEEYISLINNLDKKLKEYLFGTVKEDGTKTPGIVELYNLTKEQVKWYVWTLKNDCQGDHNMMKQENPSNPEEAFISTGSPVFNIEKIQQRIEYLRLNQTYKQGYFYFEWNNPDITDMPKPETIRWVDDKNGYIRIYEEPQEGYPYAIGGDTKGEGSDYFAGTVKNNYTGRRVATLHGQMESKPYTAQMYCLGYYYNQALIGIETNFNTYPIELLKDWKYPHQYLREKVDTIGTEIQYKYGWKTDGNTRPLIIERMITLIEENIENFVDIPTLQECLTFVKDENGRPDAMPGKHDDLLFSDMICEAVSSQQRHNIEIALKPKKELPWMFRSPNENQGGSYIEW
jgi:hypothetical protein